MPLLPDPTNEDIAVVLVGALNPAIFQPAWACRTKTNFGRRSQGSNGEHHLPTSRRWKKNKRNRTVQPRRNGRPTDFKLTASISLVFELALQARHPVQLRAIGPSDLRQCRHCLLQRSRSTDSRVRGSLRCHAQLEPGDGGGDASLAQKCGD